MKHIIIITSTILIVNLNICQAQTIDRSVIASAGSTIIMSGAQVSQTIGETAIQYISVSGVSISQGFQQTTSSTSGITEKNMILSKIDIFPNPFVHYIEISSVEILEKPSFQLVDVLGRAVAVNLIELEKGKNWKIEIGSLASGNYWLTITNGIQQSSFSLNHVAN